MLRRAQEWLAVGAVTALWLAAVCAADELEKAGGAKYTGEFLSQDDQFVHFEVHMGASKYPMKFKVGEVSAVVVDGTRHVIAAGQPAVDAAPANLPPEQPSRTEAEITELIAEAGKAKPVWWDQEPFAPLPTLDLTWTVTGWKPDENIGTHLFIVCPRPEKWKYAVKLLDRVMAGLDAGNARRRTECMILMGDFYSRLGDWARAAYWWRTAGVAGSGDQPYGLIRCYWKLGNKPLAMRMLSAVQTDRDRFARGIRLWSEMSELDKALALAEASARAHPPDPIWLAASDACRKAGDYAKAEQYYQKVLDLPGGSPAFDNNKRRAAASLGAVRLLKSLDLAALADGEHRGAGRGYRGDVEVVLSLKQGKIESARITREGEDREFDALSSIPQQVVEKQGIIGVDAVTGATVSSEAVINAVAKALAAAKK